MKPGTKEAEIRKDERREGVACREGRANLETLLRHSAKRTTSRERERREEGLTPRNDLFPAVEG